MRVRGGRGLLAGGVVLCALAVVSVVGAFRQWSTSAEDRLLQQRGVTVAATLVQATYDPSSGDPDGWTTDTVRFSTFGHVEQVVVGHHGDARPEQSSGTLSVVVDPQHPAVAMSAAELDAATPSLDFDVAAVFVAIVGLATVVVSLMAWRAVQATVPAG